MRSPAERTQPRAAVRTAGGDRLLAGRPVGRIALGTALPALSGAALEETTRTIHAALDSGARVLDGAAAYVPDAASSGFNERLIAHAIRSWDGTATRSCT